MCHFVGSGVRGRWRLLFASQGLLMERLVPKIRVNGYSLCKEVLLQPRVSANWRLAVVTGESG